MLSRRQCLVAIETVSAIGLAGCSDGGDTNGTDAPADGTDDSTDDGVNSGTDDGTGDSTDDGVNSGTDDGDSISTDETTRDTSPDTEDRSDQQVSDRLTEVNTVGMVDDGRIDTVEMTLRLEQGSSTVDLDSVTIQMTTSDGTFTLVSDQVSSPAGDGVFSYRPLKDANSSISQDGTLDDDGDRVVVTIGLGGAASGNGTYVEAPLDTGESAAVTITTEEGSETEARLTVPDTLSGEEAVVL